MQWGDGPVLDKATRLEAEARGLYEAALDSWTSERNVAFAAGERDPSFSRITWTTRHPPPEFQSFYEQVARASTEQLGVVEQPPPPEGADVEEVTAAWCARIERNGMDAEERVITDGGLLPRKALAELLAELITDGWAIAHWSNERCVVHDVNISRTELIGVSVVLQRP